MSSKLKIPSHPIVPIRMSPEDKKAFKLAAEKDSKSLGTWLKWLGKARIKEQENETSEQLKREIE